MTVVRSRTSDLVITFPPSQVIKSIYKKFTESGTTETNNKKEQRTTISSKLKLKTIYYILALTLITDNYSVNFDTLCRLVLNLRNIDPDIDVEFS